MRSANLTGSHADLVEATVRKSATAALSGVAASWRRSMLYHGLDPSRRRSPHRVSVSELTLAREAAGELLSVAEPTLQHLFRIAGQAGCCIVLTDQKGLVLTSNSNPGDAESFETWGLTEGAVWSEATEGTNGIGTCLADKAPVVIYKTQHFRADNTAMSCMGAPIYDPQGVIRAVLDVSSCRRDLDLAFAHVLGSVVTESARTVEIDLFRSAFSNARILVAGEHGKAGASLLAVDDDDLVIGATRQARKAFELTDERLAMALPVCDILNVGNRRPLGQSAVRADLRRALAQNGGNVSAAARDLGISRATMYRRLKRCGLDLDAPNL